MEKRGDGLRIDPRARYYVWVTCGSCGDMRVPGEVTTLFAGTLAYRCPGCGVRDAVPVPPVQHERLVACGFPVRVVRLPAELAESRPVAPPFTADDLLDAHELLAGTDDIVGLFGP